MTKSVLIICTSADRLGEGKDSVETGSWAEEVAAPYYIFKRKGYNVTIASPKGGEVPMDDASLNPPFLTKDAEAFLLDEEGMAMIMNSKKLSEVNAADYDAVFLPGGHGVAMDLNRSEELAKQLTDAWAAGKVVAAVCHGPNGLVGVKTPEGDSILKGKRVTGFSNTEEKAVAKDHLVPFLLEDKLKELGGSYEKVDDWQPFAIRDGRLVTGQNPQSSAKTGELIVEALEA